MRCPGCDSSLRREKHQHVEFNICSTCRGIWVSGEQFRALAVLVATEGQVQSSVKLTFEPKKVALPNRDMSKARHCPQCHKPMQEFNYAYNSNVLIDRCSQCEGIWLDPNEIIDIAAHIQYNPEAEAFARAIVKENASIENDAAKLVIVIGAVIAILRALVFRF